jgi:hypothetical protein
VSVKKNREKAIADAHEARLESELGEAETFGGSCAACAARTGSPSSPR